MEFNPGRLNRRVEFLRLTSNKNESGGTKPIPTSMLTTWCEHILVNQFNQFAIELGASVLNQDATMIIRKRQSFEPQENDIAVVGGEHYTIKAISPYRISTKNAVNIDSGLIYLVAIRKKNGQS